MSEQLGIDAGNYNVKVCCKSGVYMFRSTLGDGRDRNLKENHGDDDMEWEYNEGKLYPPGEKGFAGTLAEIESHFPRDGKGDTKAHEDAVLRVLLAVHRHAEDEVVDIVVGQPIIMHNETEKDKIKKMLKGDHTITVNGFEKTFTVRNVEVAAEGSGAFWCDPQDGKVRIIDIGSGTVNYATILDRRYVDKESDTWNVGVNTQREMSETAFAKALTTHILGRWNRNDNVFVVGGSANLLIEHIQDNFPNAKVVNPGLKKGNGIKKVQPVYANAIGFYNLARMAFS